MIRFLSLSAAVLPFSNSNGEVGFSVGSGRDEVNAADLQSLKGKFRRFVPDWDLVEKMVSVR